MYDDNTCDSECPDDEYNIDPETFDCGKYIYSYKILYRLTLRVSPPSSLPGHMHTHSVLAPTCPNLGDTVESGEVVYSRPRQSSGRYSAGTIATVECAEGYRGGDITCQTDGNWSGPLPSCTSESVIILYYI